MSDIFHLVTAGLLVMLALLCLLDRRLARACLVFIGFALTMAVAWWRLGAPWLALAEALLGALLTGAALRHALGGFPLGHRLPPRDRYLRPRHQALTRLVMPLAWFALVGLALLILHDSSEEVSLEALYRQPMLISGVVTMTLGLWAFAHHVHLLRRLLAFNVLGSGVFLLLAGVAGARAEVQALIFVGLVVAVTGSVLGAGLIRRLHASEGRLALTAGPGGDE